MNRGKYVFAQIFEFVSHNDFSKCVNRYNGDYKTKHFSCWKQFLCMAFGQLTHRESLSDTILCIHANSRKLYHLGIGSAISKSTLSKANENRDWRIYQDFALLLIAQAKVLYKDDNQLEIDFKNNVFIVDSTIINLCLSLYPWADFRKTKAAIKLHTKMDAKTSIPDFIHISDGKMHDVNFLDMITILPYSLYIMDRGYLDFSRLYRLHEAKAFFITRARKRFDFELTALEIAVLYKHRWFIETFFKWIKQHLKIKSYWGRSLNAVKTQVWIAISVYVIVLILKKKLKLTQSIYEILQILSINMFDKEPLYQLFSNLNLQDFKEQNYNQLKLFDL